MNITEALEYIHKTVWLGSKPGLSRTYKLLEKISNPHKDLKFVHVAGTNGKGSTCSFLSNILTEAGYKTGLYTSPYINFFNERMKIDGKCISDEDLCKYTEFIKPYADSMADAPTEFEIITALAFKYFADKKCDIVVLEVGMGGELDSTNVIDTPVCSVITSIGLDHTSFLGDTLSLVAKAKSGIIKGGNVVSYESSGDAFDVIKNACEKAGSTLITPDFSQIRNKHTDLYGSTFDYKNFKNIKISLLGEYQVFNAVTTLETVLSLRNSGYTISDNNIYDGFAETYWSGRFELIGKNPVFILDGAHNPHGMKAAYNSFKSLFPDKKVVFVTGAMADKDINGMFSYILPIAECFYTVMPNNMRSMPAEKLAEKLRALGAVAYSKSSFEEAVKCAIQKAGKDGIVAAVGSLYFSSDIRNAYKKVTGEHDE